MIGPRDSDVRPKTYGTPCRGKAWDKKDALALTKILGTFVLGLENQEDNDDYLFSPNFGLKNGATYQKIKNTIRNHLVQIKPSMNYSLLKGLFFWNLALLNIVQCAAH